MKKALCFALVFLSMITSVFPANAAKRFVFRNNITWGMSSELVQLYEDFAEVYKENTYSWMYYENIRVSSYSMTLEYQFVDNKLVSAVYNTPFSSKLELHTAFENLRKVYISKYGNCSLNFSVASDCIYRFYNYVEADLMTKSKATTFVTNSFFWLLDDTLILLFDQEDDSQDAYGVYIFYISRDIPDPDNDTTGI